VPRIRSSRLAACSASARPTSAPWRSAHARWAASIRGCQARELGPAVARVVLVRDEPVALEQVGHPLDALPREPQAPGDRRDRLRPVGERAEDEPARERLALRLRERLARLREDLAEPDHLDEQPRQGLALGGPVHVDSILSIRYRSFLTAFCQI
jgi:hypothetical protein